MRQRVDKLQKRCQELLGSGEEILLEAEATCKLGLLSEFGRGRAYLTGRRIVWIPRSAAVVRVLVFWIPDAVTIDLSSIDQVRMIRQLTRAWLLIEADGKKYAIRLGKGPYPALRDNPRTTEEWLHAIERVRGEYATAPAEAPPFQPLQKPRKEKLAGAALMIFVILSIPIWLLGFLLAELPLVFFLIMGVLSVVGLGIGSLMLRNPPNSPESGNT
jgi:hypothetical protein